MKYVIALVLAMQTSSAPVIDDDPNSEYVMVRRDVLAKLNESDLKLPKCEAALAKAAAPDESISPYIPTTFFISGVIVGSLQSLGMAWALRQ